MLLEEVDMYLLLFIQMAFALPSQIILIRHAEKPDYKSDILSEKGFARAQALTSIFERQPQIVEKGLPSFYFAAKFVPGESSQRSILTLQPLAEKYQNSVRSDFLTEDYKSFAQDLLTNSDFDQKVIMIAWTHTYIVQLAKALGSAPANKWNSDVFDRMWILKYQNDGRAISYDLPQKLMPGDSDK